MNPEFLTPLESQFATAWPADAWRDAHVVLAVSGGADSVAMLRATIAIKSGAGGRGQLHVAHFNHASRGADADADQRWLELLCQQLEIPLKVGRADAAALAEAGGGGWEAAAREARYKFLRAAAERVGARFVAVAHTVDDQVETVLHRVLRGTGLAGLAGIPQLRPLSPSVSLVRPLLAIRRHDVLEYLAAIGQDYRTDRSNMDPQWTRNRLRHELLPKLRENYNRDVDAALLRLAARADEAQQLIAGLAAELARACLDVEFEGRPTGERRLAKCARIDCRALQDQPPLLVRELCKRAWSEAQWPQQAMGFGQWQQLAELVLSGGEPPPITLPGNIRASRRGDLLILERFGLS